VREIDQLVGITQIASLAPDLTVNLIADPLVIVFCLTLQGLTLPHDRRVLTQVEDGLRWTREYIAENDSPLREFMLE